MDDGQLQHSKLPTAESIAYMGVHILQYSCNIYHMLILTVFLETGQFSVASSSFLHRVEIPAVNVRIYFFPATI